MNHVFPGCSVSAKKYYVHKHDRVKTYIHWNLFQHYGISTGKGGIVKGWLENIAEEEKPTILWNMSRHTQRNYAQ